jgi:predicted ester cyclase
VSIDATTKVMNGYLDALLSGADLGEFFTDDVSWTTIETGDQVQGREAVRDFIVTFHTKLFDARPEVKTLVVGDGVASLEGDFVGTHTGDFAGIAPTGASLQVPYAVFSAAATSKL